MIEAPEIIKELVDRFDRNIESYKKSSYKEEQIKQEFINPFFKALGWDVDNTKGGAPQYRDVIFEDSIKVGGGTKAPDYCFTLSGKKMFFVEAKKPSVNLKDGIKPAYQLRRYAWSAKLPLSILTDFEEFVIYESRTLPKKNDRTSTGRILYLTYKDYVDRWDEIYNIFSRDAVFKGAFDQYAESTTKKRGTQEVDDAFLKEIEGWRELFAKNIALRNKELNVEELNYAVQQIIDRIIFLRMAEDRGIEKYGKLQTLLEHNKIYNSFTEICKEADEKYNSGLFHFKEAKGRNTAPDKLTPELTIDNGVFKTVIKDLYYPDSPYEFSVLPPEILGNVYEQFLGKVIRLTPSHMAKVEEKPEVKKAGGIFYTPKFIVDYIVENTVGELIKSSTPPKVSKLRILDPACGSGSFLLGAYTYLLKWHLDYYLNLKNKNKETIYEGKNGEWHLTIQEKKRILQDNIYGIDIDPQAVEVTKLSLLLKVLEGENKDALEAQQKLITEKALPDLDDNIKCGNSIIGTVGLNNTDIQRFNAFDWDEEFSEIKKNGGFDAVIGNPPYVRQEKIKEIKPYLKDHYETYTGVADLYVYFFERGLKLLKEGGMFSYICSNKFTRAKYGTNLRKFILKYNLKQYIDYTGKNVFEDATVDPCVTIIKKEERGNNGTVLINDEFEIPQNRLNELGWILKPIEILDLNEKIIAQGKKIKDIKNLKFYRGILTGYNKAFIIDENIKKDLISKDPKNSEIIKPMIMGRNIKKWEIDFKNNYLIFTRRGIDINKYPVIKEYLIAFKEKLTPRNEGQKVGRKPGDYKWYEIQDTISYYKEFEREKLIYPVITSSLFAVFDKNKFYLNDKCFMIASDDLNLKFLNALLASKTLNFVFKLLGSPLGKSGIELRKIYVEQLPIYPATPEEQKPLIELADQMLQLHEDIKTARTPQEKKSIERQISATDKQVDNLVYELYGMNEDEIKIVEKS